MVASATNYANKTVTSSATSAVAKQDLTVTTTNYSEAYDGSEHYATIKVTSSEWTGKTIVSGTSTSYGTNVTTNGAVNTSYNLKPGYTDFTNGAKTVYYKVTGGTYYNDKTGSATVTVSKKALSIDAYSVNLTSGATTYARNSYATGVGSETINLTYTPYANSAGTYTYATSAAAGKFTLALSDNTNYSISTAGDLTIIADTMTSPTVSFETNYVSSNLQILLDGVNNTGNGLDESASTWTDIKGHTTIKRGSPWFENEGMTFNQTTGGSNTTGHGIMVNYQPGALSAVTVEAAFKPFSRTINTSYSRPLISNSHNGGVYLAIEDGYPNFQVYAGGSWRSITGPFKLTSGEYYSMQGVYDGMTLSLYVDGRLVASSKEFTTATSIGAPNSGTYFGIGCDPNGNSSCQTSSNSEMFFIGRIYSARVYNTALSFADLNHNYRIDSMILGRRSAAVTPEFNITGGSSTVTPNFTQYGYTINSANAGTYTKNGTKPTVPASVSGSATIAAHVINEYGGTGPNGTRTATLETRGLNIGITVERRGAQSIDFTITKGYTVESDSWPTSTNGLDYIYYKFSTSSTCNNSTTGFTMAEYTSGSTIFSASVSSAGTYTLCVKYHDIAGEYAYASETFVMSRSYKIHMHPQYSSSDTTEVILGPFVFGQSYSKIIPTYRETTAAKNGLTLAANNTTYAPANVGSIGFTHGTTGYGLRGWSYNPAGTSGFNEWRVNYPRTGTATWNWDSGSWGIGEADSEGVGHLHLYGTWSNKYYVRYHKTVGGQAETFKCLTGDDTTNQRTGCIFTYNTSYGTNKIIEPIGSWTNGNGTFTGWRVYTADALGTSTSTNITDWPQRYPTSGSKTWTWKNGEYGIGYSEGNYIDLYGDWSNNGGSGNSCTWYIVNEWQTACSESNPSWSQSSTHYAQCNKLAQCGNFDWLWEYYCTEYICE